MSKIAMLAHFLRQKMATALPMNPRAVSLALPLRDEPYDSSTLFSFFDGLIPEGWLLNVVTRNWKLNRKDRFGLLLVACRDTIGNVTIQEVRK